jgi:hypothetical protein
MAKNFNNAMVKKIKVEMIFLSDIGYMCTANRRKREKANAGI